MKLVINKKKGRYGISFKGLKYLSNKGRSAHMWEFETKDYNDFYPLLDRDDPCLVNMVEELGSEANGSYASLCVVEIPDDVCWSIRKVFDGRELIIEEGRIWYPLEYDAELEKIEKIMDGDSFCSNDLDNFV